MSYDQKYFDLLDERGRAENDLMAAQRRLSAIERELIVRIYILNRDARPMHPIRPDSSAAD